MEEKTIDYSEEELNMIVEAFVENEKGTNNFYEMFKDVEPRKINYIFSSYQMYKFLDKDIINNEMELKNDPALPYGLALISKDKNEIKKYSQYVIDSKNPWFNYLFALNIEGINIKDHEQAVIDSKDPYYCYMFACDIKGANIKDLAQVIIDSKDPSLNFKFARDVSGADIKAHKKVVIESEEPTFNCHFACSIKDGDIKEHERIVLDSKHSRLNFEFAKKVPESDILAHADVIIENSDQFYMKKFNNLLKNKTSKAQDDQTKGLYESILEEVKYRWENRLNKLTLK